MLPSLARRFESASRSGWRRTLRNDTRNVSGGEDPFAVSPPRNAEGEWTMVTRDRGSGSARRNSVLGQFGLGDLVCTCQRRTGVVSS